MAIAKLRGSYGVGNFRGLEKTFDCLMQPNQKTSSGEPGSAIVYQFFKAEMPAPGVATDEEDRVARWRSQLPNSTYSEFAKLRLQYAMAWNERGALAGRQVSRSSYDAFQQKLADAESALLSASPELKKTPIWHYLLLAVVADEHDKRDRMQAVFESGVQQWPQYYDLYSLMVSRLWPRWGGSWKQVDAFITTWAERTSATEGDTLYARLYLSTLWEAKVDPSDTLIRWPRLKAAIEELLKRYPDTRYANAAASLGCAYGDEAYYRLSLQRIGPRIDPQDWLEDWGAAICKEQFGV